MFIHVELAYSVWFHAMETKTLLLINLLAFLLWSTVLRNISQKSLNTVAINQP